MKTKAYLDKMKEIYDYYMPEINYWLQEIDDWQKMDIPEQVEKSQKALDGLYRTIQHYIDNWELFIND